MSVAAYKALTSRLERTAKRLNEVHADLLERSRAWHVDGIATDRETLSTLEAERAALRVDLAHLRDTVRAIKRNVQRIHRTELLDVLKQRLVNIGMHDMLNLAHDEARANMQAADRALSQYFLKEGIK